MFRKMRVAKGGDGGIAGASPRREPGRDGLISAALAGSGLFLASLTALSLRCSPSGAWRPDACLVECRKAAK